MNAQQLINETPVNHFDWKVFWKPQSLSKHTNDDRGDKFVARKGNNQYPQDVSMGFFTSFQGNSVSPDAHNLSLKPRTFNYTKKQEAINNLEAQKVLKDLGIEVL